jgi:hypothetical protein
LNRLSVGTSLVDPLSDLWVALPDNGATILFTRQTGSSAVLLQRRWDEVNMVMLFNLDVDTAPLAFMLDEMANHMSEADWGL